MQTPAYQAYSTKGNDAKHLVMLLNCRQHSMELYQKQRGFMWVTGLPINEHGLLCQKLLSEMASSLDVIGHSRICHPIAALGSHNEMKRVTGTSLTQACHGIATKTYLQRLSGESLSYHSAITKDDAQLDIEKYGLWRVRFKKAFVDVWVLSPRAQLNYHVLLQFMYLKHEQERTRQYYQRVCDFEHACRRLLRFLIQACSSYESLLATCMGALKCANQALGQPI